MKLRRKIQITGYITSDTDDDQSLFNAITDLKLLAGPPLPEDDGLRGAAIRKLADLEVKLGPAKQARAAPA